MADASQGYAGKFCADPLTNPGSVDENSEPYEFTKCSIGKRATILHTDGIRGTRSESVERTRAGTYEVGGTVTFHPSPADLDKWLPRILGADESTDTFALAETLPEFNVAVDYVADAFEYTACKVNRAVFRGSASGLIELDLDIIGKTQADITYPTLALGTSANDRPYVFSDGVLTLVSSARDMMDFELVIDNQLDARFTNSQTATSITPKTRMVTLKTTNPFTSSEVDLLGQANDGTTGTLVFTNGNMSTTFTFAKLQVPEETPEISGKDEIKMTLNMVARKSGSTDELVVTHDSTA